MFRKNSYLNGRLEHFQDGQWVFKTFLNVNPIEFPKEHIWFFFAYLAFYGFLISIYLFIQKETGSVLSNVGAHLDLSAFSSPEELASLGLDRLKSALMALGLKCGG